VDGAIVVLVALAAILADRLEPELLAVDLVPDTVCLVLELVRDRGGDVEIALEPCERFRSSNRNMGLPFSEDPAACGPARRERRCFSWNREGRRSAASV